MSNLSKVITMPFTERQITYHVLSPEHLHEIIEKASERSALIKPVNAAKRYDVSEEFLNDMATQGRINKYTVSGHPRMIRYKIEELDKLFKS